MLAKIPVNTKTLSSPESVIGRYPHIKYNPRCPGGHRAAQKGHRCYSASAPCRGTTSSRSYRTTGAVTRATLHQFFEQGFGLLEIGGVKALSEPAIDRCQEVAGFGAPALLLPQACQAHCRPQLQRFRLLAAGHVQSP